MLNHIKSFVDGPWVCIGDFNAILCSIEKLSLRSANSQLMEDFHHALEQFELIDLGYKGNTYTWNNRQRLDRAIGNELWKAKFPSCIVTHLPTHANTRQRFDFLSLGSEGLDIGRNEMRGPHNQCFKVSLAFTFVEVDARRFKGNLLNFG